MVANTFHYQRGIEGEYYPYNGDPLIGDFTLGTWEKAHKIFRRFYWDYGQHLLLDSVMRINAFKVAIVVNDDPNIYENSSSFSFSANTAQLRMSHIVEQIEYLLIEYYEGHSCEENLSPLHHFTYTFSANIQGEQYAFSGSYEF